MRCVFTAMCVSLVGLSTLHVDVAVASEPSKKWRVSCFAYRDDNRNGVYDMADRPYAGLRVELKRPDGSVVSRDSNISGFANFDASLGDKDVHVFEPGQYVATARPRAG